MKDEGALQEAEETIYWLELLTESGISSVPTTALHDEADHLIAILVTLVTKVKNHATKETARRAD